MPNYDPPECIAARSAFNTNLTVKSGMARGESSNSVARWYLSSTEHSEKIDYSVNLKEGYYSFDSKSLDGNIRWIRNF